MKLQTYMLADLCIHISSLLSEVGNFLQRTFKLGSCVRNSLGPRTSAIRPRLTSNTVIEMIKISIDVWINACFLCQTGVHRVVPDMVRQPAFSLRRWTFLCWVLNILTLPCKVLIFPFRPLFFFRRPSILLRRVFLSF